ncbi:PAS domain S-box-containing protein/diguanylate cyclase (GGDEF) domain-containing protein [Caldanaerovirga acetigignens]|uniref:Stage 0 sporulation protein A homolog n=1 Tax=Caldanaerovirga acetigignens TaxID=447595 RepID=A0A1M7I898_9FIRM|nr:PAS domain S-box protein [Caldanaerovirga acetigignens]SHM36753.1 PAS domain S-box-containing protein/diguanylate cyclase (GGDEF) domain-containing protein [Caldanaerovirga acetigignens]
MENSLGKILLVEDSRLSAKITEDILKKYGFELDTVRSGEDALERIKRGNKYILVLMDIELIGKLNGIDAALLIQKITDIPIVFFTSHVNREIMEKIKSVTSYGYIKKGSDENVLVYTVETALKLHAANKMIRQSEELFRNMFETNKLVMILVNPKNGKIIEANKSALEFYGYEKSKLLSMKLEDISAKNIGKKSCEKNCLEVLKEECNPCLCSQRISDGSVRFVEVYSSLISYQNKECLYLIIFDVTDKLKAENELKLYKDLFEFSPYEKFIFYPDTFKFFSANKKFLENCGYSWDELKEKTPLDIHKEMTEESFRSLLEPLNTGEKEVIIIPTNNYRKDGSHYPVEVHIMAEEFAGKKIFSSVAFDETKCLNLERELHETEEILHTILQHAGDAIVITNESGSIIYWNPSAEQMFGYKSQEAIGTELQKLLALNDSFLSKLKGLINKSGQSSQISKFEFETKRRDGSSIEVELSLSTVIINGKWHAIAIFRDITERKKNERLLFLQAITDPLTGIYNRRYIIQMIENEVLRFKRTGKPFSLIIFDLDHFKKINDTFGHAAGDMTLKKIADVIKKRIRKTDILGRWGGEEFIILLPETSIENATSLANELKDKLEGVIFPKIGRITASFGVTSSRSEDDVDSIISRADELLYKGKAAGRNCVISDT